MDRWEFGSFGSRFFIGSLTLTNNEISSDDSSWNDRGSGGGRRALTRTAINSTHPGENQWTKRMFAWSLWDMGWVRCRPREGRVRRSELFDLISRSAKPETWRPRDQSSSIRALGKNKTVCAFDNLLTNTRSSPARTVCVYVQNEWESIL